MFTKFMGNGNFRLLLESVSNGENCTVFGLNKGEKLAVVDSANFLFYVVDSVDNLNPIYDSLVSLGRKCTIFCEPLNIFSSEFASSEKMLKTLYQLKSGDVDTVILTPEMLCQKVINKKYLNSICINVGDELVVDRVASRLIDLGYSRVDLVSGVGEFSVRGEVIDIFPLMGEPTRITTGFDIVESIKYYNAVTMLSNKSIESIEIPLFRFYNVSSQSVENYYQKNGLKKDSNYYDICDNIAFLDYKNIIFDEKIDSTIFDYVDDALIVFDGARSIYEKLNTYISDYNAKIKALEKHWAKLLSFASLDITKVLEFKKEHTLLAYQHINQSNRIFSPKRVFSIRTLPSVNYVRHTSILALDIKNYNKAGYTIILCAGSDDNRLKLSEDLGREGVKCSVYDRISQCLLGGVNVVSRNYPLDILLPEEKLIVVSTNSLFGIKKKIVEKDNGFYDGETPKNGDFIVHNFHGVGKCLGVETLKLSDSYRDYVVIEYKNNDKLYLPVENLDQVTKYVGGESSPSLNKIGGVEFAKTKARIKSAVKKIAFDLIALYRDRLNMKGYQYPKDMDMQNDFENSFEFAETEDQKMAIDDCKNDMESGKVMDRLVCGDVGFGKTEVALRIAFKTILSGKQVAFLCPTTILSEQHYSTAMERMSQFGVKVAVLNRLKTPKQVAQIKKDISDGKIDLICGTHKLLASDINYKNLGLLVLDEEQKFGVADKEKIKNIKKQVNVLTLSATPIPRTLNMALMGIRDISVIQTAPTQRQSSIVNVSEYSEGLLKEAISRELSRDGQVLIVYNRVEKIYNFSAYISSLFEGVPVSVAHGQMGAEELEKEIFNLYSGKTKILVSTTLIENGVDLPNANTLIVINADTLGLSQLYQLKGRIGRSDKLAFAYFTFDKSKALSETAYKRLQAIEEFSEMGSGFKIAMRDLEIRGAGSVLGLEQSGHIEKIGYNMYVQMLSDTVREMKGESVKEKIDVRVETNLSAYLSKDYVESVTRRMSMYREIAALNTLEKLVAFLTNTKEVYGDIPDALVNLCKISLIKNLASEIGAKKVVIKSCAKIILEHKEDLTKSLLDVCDMYSDKISLNLAENPTIEIMNIDRNEILDFLVNYLQLIINC
ncbi:MAG: transcription-repair coupling factor [Clostridiales bacterium]|nr:transcription-repair coupling factor [Clostridiales bacterium]